VPAIPRRGSREFSHFPGDAASGAGGGGDDERFAFWARRSPCQKKAVSPLVPSTPRKTVSETKGIFGNFWKKLFADASMIRSPAGQWSRYGDRPSCNRDGAIRRFPQANGAHDFTDRHNGKVGIRDIQTRIGDR